LKEALRAASVFLDDKQRGVVSAFVQAPFTGNYNAQSGEIVGVLKNMNDTFTANLANARQVESKGIFDYNAMMKVMEEEHDEMSALFEGRRRSERRQSSSPRPRRRWTRPRSALLMTRTSWPR